jgi:hypothetical protein
LLIGRRARDRQRGRVYRWEDATVAPCAPRRVVFSAAQGMVDAIWADQGLRYPPLVERLARQARRTVASANRLALYLPEDTPEWCLLHELAHAMSTTAEGASDGHGPVFVGLYVKLLVRYVRLDEADLLASLRLARIEVNRDARPVFLDAPFVAYEK